MKILVASDIHGSAYWCERLLERFEKEGAERILLLGDILYHGPRNDLPRDYAPKKVIAMLNEKRDLIWSVRGNCEAEVDQMVLTFPVLADYCIVTSGSKAVYATHGHVYNEGNLPPLKEGDVLLHGHTHVWKAEKMQDHYLLNPGSVSIPKENNPETYAILEDDVFTVKTMDGDEIGSIVLE